MATYDFHPNSALFLGASFDSDDPFTSKADCITYDSIGNVDFPGGTSGALQTSFEFREIQSRRDLYESTRISVNLSARYKFFNGSASVNSFNSLDFSENSIVWSIRAFADYGRNQISNPRLKPEYQQLLDNGDTEAFRRACGTEFVRLERRVALVSAIFSLRELSQTKVSELRTRLSVGASSPVLGGQLEASFDSFMREALQISRINYIFVAYGGGGIGETSGFIENMDSISGLKSSIADYISRINVNTAAPVSYITQSMKSFDTRGELADPLNEIREKVLGDLYLEVERCSEIVTRLTELMRATGGVAPPSRLEEFSRIRTQYTEAVSSIIRQALSCREDLSQCTLPPLPPPDLSFPLKQLWINSVQWNPQESRLYIGISSYGLLLEECEVFIESTGLTKYVLPGSSPILGVAFGATGRAYRFWIGGPVAEAINQTLEQSRLIIVPKTCTGGPGNVHPDYCPNDWVVSEPLSVGPSLFSFPSNSLINSSKEAFGITPQTCDSTAPDLC